MFRLVISNLLLSNKSTAHQLPPVIYHTHTHTLDFQTPTQTAISQPLHTHCVAIAGNKFHQVHLWRAQSGLSRRQKQHFGWCGVRCHIQTFRVDAHTCRACSKEATSGALAADGCELPAANCQLHTNCLMLHIVVLRKCCRRLLLLLATFVKIVDWTFNIFFLFPLVSFCTFEFSLFFAFVKISFYTKIFLIYILFTLSLSIYLAPRLHVATMCGMERVRKLKKFSHFSAHQRCNSDKKGAFM